MAPRGQTRVSEEIRRAVARGALTRERAGHYLAQAADNPDQAGAVADLVSRLWGPGQGLPTDDPDGIMGAIWPDDPPGQIGHEPDRLGQLDARRAWLRSHAAADPPGGGELVPGHNHPAVWGEHEHPHSDYQGGVHTHRHTHSGEGDHSPREANHMHQLASSTEQVAAGIRRRASEHAAEAGRQRRVWELSDDELLDSLGPPPGRW